jgi:hypothetical protein
MASPTFSPDGKWMWDGTEWIPAPPTVIPAPIPTSQTGVSPTVIPAPIPVDFPPSNSNQWHHLFVKDSVYCWEGEKGKTLINAKVGRLIIAKEGVVFVSSGSAQMGKSFAKALIPIIGPLMAMSGPSTVDLDPTDLSKAGSLKIPKSDLTSFRVEGSHWMGRYLRIYSRSNGDYSFSTKAGFKKSVTETLNRLENIDLW